MYRKTISLVLMIALVGLVGTAVAMAQGQTDDDGKLPVDPADVAARSDPQRAIKIYATIQGETQGEIKGGATAKGREDWIEVLGYSHEIVRPLDAASGLPTGKRQHKPLTITKRVDKSTPLLMSALTSNENLTEVRLEFVRTDKTGKAEHYFTIELTNARVLSVISERDPDGLGPLMEAVVIAYQTMAWTSEDGGTTHQDDWSESAAALTIEGADAMAS